VRSIAKRASGAGRTAGAAIICHKASVPLSPLHHRRGPRAR
jgi:hypothetical protein